MADAQPHTRRSRFFAIFFDAFTGFSVLIVALLIVGALVSLFIFAEPALQKSGLNLFAGSNWDPSNDEYGGLPFIVGTLITSILALLISLPFSLAIALFLGEYFPKGTISTIINSVIELLAGIPSIIYGIWGFFFLIPLVQQIEMNLHLPAYGGGVLTASILLAVMIIPYSASLAREVVSMVPRELKEAAYSLGATRFGVITKVTIPHALSGIFAGQLLAFGRALGETMAVAMVIGNENVIPKNVFSSGATIASVIANEYPETGFGDLHASALTALGLILLVITLVFGIIGRWVINRMSLKR